MSIELPPLHWIGASLVRADSVEARERILLARIAELESALSDAVALYGKPGGPWNIPSDPGGWLERARAAIDAARGAK